MYTKKVLAVAAECAPFIKTGGLADVVGTLPAELGRLGMETRVMLPLHRVIKEKYRDELRHVCDFETLLGIEPYYVGVEMLEKNGVVYYFIDNDEFFGDYIYLGGDREIKQYIFFSRAVPEALLRIDYEPDIIHCNDWHTALIPVFLKLQYNFSAKTALSIHNLRYQGRCDIYLCKYLTGLPDGVFGFDGLESYGVANILKGGISFCDMILTVSPTYAEEIKFEYYGEGLASLLKWREEKLIGILNGIDTASFNPATDAQLPFNYSIDDLSGKRLCKKALAEELSLTIDGATPIIGIVTRMTEQKGIDLIMRVLDELMQFNDVALVVLGSGEGRYEDFFYGASMRYAGKIAVRTGYDDALARRIYAGSDLFLMPSKFEPCGLSQMIAQRYGSLPIVRETGGLKDTVTPYNKYTGEGNGFSFTNYNAHDMLYTIRFALATLSDNDAATKLIRQAMSIDNSFVVSAKKYADVFQSM